MIWGKFESKEDVENFNEPKDESKGLEKPLLDRKPSTAPRAVERRPSLSRSIKAGLTRTPTRRMSLVASAGAEPEYVVVLSPCALG